eukprot:8160414-Pyramimonas_sp.AAC.2
MAALACECERYVGTQGGGMDQAISILATRGVAKLVNFNPLRTSDVVLPKGSVLVVANSLTPSAKAETASVRFNARVVECQLASIMLAIKHEMFPETAVKEVKTLLDFENRVADYIHPPVTGPATSEALDLVDGLLPSDVHSAAQVESTLQCSLEKLFEGQPAMRAAAAHLAAGTGFRLRHRAQHVYSEALRVRQFQSLCEEASSGALPLDDALNELGKLMNSSHESCRDLYQCSCRELDELVFACRKLGASGARLTGAGWGGCVVALLREEQVGEFLPALREMFYAPRLKDGRLSHDRLPDVLFATAPGTGAALIL